MSKRNRKRGVPVDMVAGTIHKTNSYGDCEVVNYYSAHNVEVRFIGYNNIIIVGAGHLRKGRAKNPMMPKVYGVGFFGIGNYSKVKDTIAYAAWNSMLQRCYDAISLKKRPTYFGCSVCKEWYNFQVFAEWFYKYGGHKTGYHIDKDILKQGNKVYGPATCIFVPSEVNVLFSLNNSLRGEYLLGVCRRKNGKYQAECHNGTESVHLGTFDTQEEAHAAYCVAKYERIKRVAETVDDERLKVAMLKYRLPKY